MRKLLWVLAVLAIAGAEPARADWHEARTGHFIINVDDSEAAARDFAIRLERFDHALRMLYGIADSADRRANPVRVFALRSDLFYESCGCQNVLGYYNSRIGGSVIFTAYMPELDRKAQPGSWSSQTVLLHEYGHHFLYSNSPLAYPTWFVEGFAEFNANVIFNEDGSITLGVPANYRAEVLKSGGRLSAREFFEPYKYGFGRRPDLIYGRGWLLTHYLMLSPRREGQLKTYLTAMNRGKTSAEAAAAAFGDVGALYAEMIAYGRGVLAPPVRIPAPDEAIGVTVTRLSAGEAEMLPVRALLTNGVARGYGLSVALQARRVAARHPDDPAVQTRLAEAEYQAGKLDRADAAAGRALALRPDLVEALLWKGRIAMRRAQEAKASDRAAWAGVRGWFVKANRADPNAPLPLYLYYRSFVAAGITPPQAAVDGLSRAAVLAPESSEVRVTLAHAMLGQGDGATARVLLAPIAFAPHRRTYENLARAAVDLIDAGKLDAARAALDGRDLGEGEED